MVNSSYGITGHQVCSGACVPLRRAQISKKISHGDSFAKGGGVVIFLPLYTPKHVLRCQFWCQLGLRFSALRRSALHWRMLVRSA
jgi:hypothetical protein